MKRNISGAIAGLGLATLTLFTAFSYEPKMASAEVEKIDGLYIFTDSEPVMEYETLGTLEVKFILDTQYESIRNKLIKNTRKDFPKADALIMHFDAKGIDKCDAIRFK